MHLPGPIVEPRTVSSRIRRRLRTLLARSSPEPGREVGVGLIGAGNVAHWQYLPKLRQAGSRLRLKAVFDVNAEAARRVAGEFSIPSCSSVDELIRREDVEAVLVCTPTPAHSECALAALEQRKHVLCEKPLGSSHAEARRMWAASRRAGVVNMVNFSFRFRPEFRLVHQLVESGTLGRIHHLWGSISQGRWFNEDGSPSLERSDAASWKFDAENGGVLRDMGPHVLDLARWWMGDIRQVQGWTRPSWGNSSGADAACGMSLSFHGGGIAQLLTSRLATGFKEQTVLELSGSRGAVRIDERGMHLWTRTSPKWQKLLSPLPGPDVLSTFHGAITGAALNWATFWDGLTNNEALEAVMISARSGNNVPIPLEHESSAEDSPRLTRMRVPNDPSLDSRDSSARTPALHRTRTAE